MEQRRSVPVGPGVGRAARGVWLAVVVCVLAGCGGTPSPTGGEKPAGGGKQVKLPDPCTLLTASEIKSVTKSEIADQTMKDPTLNVGQSACTWQHPPGVVGKIVDVVVDGTDPVYPARALFDRAKRDAPNAEDISGLGEAAYGVAKGLNGETAVGVLKGDFFLTVRIRESDQVEMAKELAAKAVARL